MDIINSANATNAEVNITLYNRSIQTPKPPWCWYQSKWYWLDNSIAISGDVTTPPVTASAWRNGVGLSLHGQSILVGTAQGVVSPLPRNYFLIRSNWQQSIFLTWSTASENHNAIYERSTIDGTDNVTRS